MTKVIGYSLAILGLVILSLSFGLFSVKLPVQVPSAYVSSAGIILVIVGIFLLLQGGKKQAKEVPIYEGTGKKRKIVGYRRLRK